jgi:hypothetical protein
MTDRLNRRDFLRVIGAAVRGPAGKGQCARLKIECGHEARVGGRESKSTEKGAER